MKRLIVLSVLFLAVLAVAFSVSQLVLGKGHVPVNQKQLCHAGQAIQVSAAGGAVGTHLGHGDCKLPACDFANNFSGGDVCNNEISTGRRCVLDFERVQAETPACPPGRF